MAKSVEGFHRMLRKFTKAGFRDVAGGDAEGVDRSRGIEICDGTEIR